MTQKPLTRVINEIIKGRFRKGWTQGQLAKSSGVLFSKIKQIEKRETIPTFSDLLKLIFSIEPGNLRMKQFLKNYPRHLDYFSIEILKSDDCEAYQALKESQCLTFSQFKNWAKPHLNQCGECHDLYEISLEEKEDINSEIELTPSGEKERKGKEFGARMSCLIKYGRL